VVSHAASAIQATKIRRILAFTARPPACVCLRELASAQRQGNRRLGSTANIIRGSWAGCEGVAAARSLLVEAEDLLDVVRRWRRGSLIGCGGCVPVGYFMSS
jgi:hypothetical protein